MRKSRSPLKTPWLTLAAGFAAALPVVVATARALRAGWQPVADRGIIATRAYDVFSSHTPLVGQYSYAGHVTGKLTYSLGPMLYWLLAPAAHLGAPATLILTTATVNVAAIVGSVALARRRGGVWLMLAAAIAIALMCRSLAAMNFYDIWNPSAALFPLLLLVFVCWSLACGEYRLLPLAALVGSFCAQCEDAFIPPTLGLALVGLVGLALTRNVRRRWVLAALGVLVVCWTAPVIDQVADHGNLGLVLQAATERESPLGTSVGLRAVAHAVGVPPWWLTRPSSPWSRKVEVRRPLSTIDAVSSVLILGWLLLAFVLALRRRRPELASGVAIALILCAALGALARSTPSKPLLAETLGYTLWWGSIGGMFVWLIGGFALWELVGRKLLLAAGGRAGREGQRLDVPISSRLARGAGTPAVAAVSPFAVLALAVVALAGGVTAAEGAADEHDFEFPALATINSRVAAVPSGRTVLLNAQLDGVITPLRPELTFDLRTHGVRALGTGAYLRLGHWYEKWAHPYEYVMWMYDKGAPLPGGNVLARTSITSGGRRRTITVAIAPASAAEGTKLAADVKAVPRTTAATASVGRRAAYAQPSSFAWSPPATLASGCRVQGAPQVAFPSEGPTLPTGRGTVVWASGAGSCADASAAGGGTVTRVAFATVGSSERPELAGARSLRGSPAGAPAAVGASFGRVALAVGRDAAAASAGGALTTLLQGSAESAAASRAIVHRGLPFSLAHAYLGDVALATASVGAIAVRLQRHYETWFEPARLIPIPPGQVTALVATMDYRSDVLVAWEQNGWIYADVLRASGRIGPTQRVGPSASDPQLQALISDDNHGMIAWASTTGARSAARTRIYLDLSAVGVRFGAPQVLAAFADPAEVGRQPGTLGLVRLAGENVMMDWTDAEHGHYVVRSAPPVFATTRPTTLLSDPRGQSALAALTPGPTNEAVALWMSAAGRTIDERAPRGELWAARSWFRHHDRVGMLPAQRVAAPGPGAGVGLGVDPANDRALAAWYAPASGRVEYSVGAGTSAYRPQPPPSVAAAPASGVHWLRITGAVLLALALLLLGGVLLRGRSRRRRPRAAAR